MNKKKILHMLGVFLVAAAAGAGIYTIAPKLGNMLGGVGFVGGPAVEVKWDQLYKLDYKTGKVPDELKAFDGKRVKIAGFVVPLSDNYSILEEFLLVPDAQSCVHVPPPPPNLIVQSKLKVPIGSDKVFNPAWITGVLKIEKTESKYGAAGFQMVVEKLEEYVY